MIVKVVPAAKAGDERVVASYILHDRDRGNGQHDKIEWSRATNCGTDDPHQAIDAIERHNQQNTRKHRVSQNEHVLISFPQGERPTEEQCKIIESRLMERIGWGDHPRISSGHRSDGKEVKNFHIHVVCSRINPETLHAEHPRHSHFSLQCEAARLELDLGLTIEAKTLLPRERAEIDQRRSLDRAHTERHPEPDPATPAAHQLSHPVLLYRTEPAMSESRNQRDEIRDRDEEIAGLRTNVQNTQQLRDEHWQEMSAFSKAGDRLGLRPDEQFRELGLNQSEAELRLKEAVTERLRGMSNEERLDELRLSLAPDGRPLTHDSLAAQMNDDYRQISHQHHQLRQELVRADRDVHGMERQFHSLERAHDQRWDDMNAIQRALHNTGIYEDKRLGAIEHDMASLLHDAGNRMAERAELAAGHERLGEIKEAAFRELRPQVEHELGKRQERGREALEYYRARERERSHEHEMGMER